MSTPERTTPVRAPTRMAYKLLQLVGVLLLLVGVAARTGAGEFWGAHLAVVGLMMFTVGRIAAWLHHG